MKDHLLICDNSASLGRAVAHGFMTMGIPSRCCKSSLLHICREISKGNVCGVVLFAFTGDERLFRFIRQAKDIGIPVFIGIYSSSLALQQDFRRAGAADCFIMPCALNELCRRTVLLLSSGDDITERIEILLEELGFPRRLSGFFYLAHAAVIALETPEKLWGGMNDIYQEVADACSTSAPLVERAMRNLAAQAFECGAVFRLTDGRLTEKPTNNELICAVCDLIKRLKYF